MHKWTVHVKELRTWQSHSLETINLVQSSFRQLGFTVVPIESLYYNPTAKSRFTVEHVKDSAMTLWLLKYGTGWLTVKIIVDAVD